MVVENNEEIKKALKSSVFYRTCDCGPTHINCMTAKEWMISQIGVWQFLYEKRDVRNKNLHPIRKRNYDLGDCSVIGSAA